jgi:hemerythrin-like domain-containing protein
MLISNHYTMYDIYTGRRKLIRTGLSFAAAGMAGGFLLNACATGKGKEKDVSPTEDLMQEHGLLNRLLLVYDNCRLHLQNNQRFPVEAIGGAASLIRVFIEDYHEKQEEDYLFPRFRKANILTELVDTLLRQHKAGRAITDRVIQLAKTQLSTAADRAEMLKHLTAFNNMYRPHEAREDTVLFPEFRKLVTRHELDSLGGEFERNEEHHFGKNGFQELIARVESLERALGIYDLDAFTPAV